MKWVYLGVVMFAGAVFGSIFIQVLPSEQQLRLGNELTLYMNWMKQSSEVNSSYMFWDAFFGYFKWVVLLFVLGITVIGVPLIIVLNFLKGFLIGCSIHIVVQMFGTQGVLLSLVTVVPHNVIAVPVILILSSTAIGFSTFIVKKRLMTHAGNVREAFISYSAVAMSMLILLAVAAFIEVYISPQVMEWYLVQIPM
ncbi:stage II sporulation protein M [Paenibacillus endoradicis]|uniref:stage II sporulation protein M n=1 Tax=Paenibacillus endoradicis TaxID=2972487 RepID=UPI002158B72C|nr:stage II sporulation protein M [Paenibacillus endoradicis]MCR8660364.1 stage II sporulation protein M [Paenibacillus endoradicis]